MGHHRPGVVRRLLATAVALAAGAAATLVGASPAQAFPGAFYPTLRLGNRGVDVQAVGYLLQHHQFDAPTDGVFNSTLDSVVRAFQSTRNLSVDGIVGPQTWGALIVTLRSGNTGPAVRALQVQLNRKRGLGLPVTGTFDDATTSAVRSFQSHASISVDGVVGPVTWTNLLWHYVHPDLSTGICDQDPDGNGTANWGTAAATAQLEAAVTQFVATGRGEVPLGDASFEHGGTIPGHASHQVGLDIDLWPIRTDAAQCTAGRITWRSETYDRDATRELIRAIRATAPGHVKLIFFNDPVLISEGLTVEWPNHDNHLHVRYCAAVHPNSSYVCGSFGPFLAP